MEIFAYITLIISTYILGAIPNAFIVVKLITGKNVMKHGTKNVGTMNTHRTTNSKPITTLVLLLELAKGMVAFGIVYFLIQTQQINETLALSLGVFFSVLGHNYSIFLGLKGGKGLAAAAGYFLLSNPAFVSIWIIGFVIITALSKYMVLGQIVATVLLPTVLLSESIYNDNYENFAIALPACILIFIAHYPRLKKVINGKEPKMYYKERK